MNGTNKELVEMAATVSNMFKREVDEKGLKLSITAGGKQGKAITLSGGEVSFQQCSKKGVVLATSVETLGVDLRTRTTQKEV